MTFWKRLRSTLADEARLASAVLPAVMAAANTFQALRGAQNRRRLQLGRTTFSIEHDDRYRAYVLLALAGGAALGVAGALLFSPHDADTSKEVDEEPSWSRVSRIPAALKAARSAAQHAFHRALADDEPRVTRDPPTPA